MTAVTAMTRLAPALADAKCCHFPRYMRESLTNPYFPRRLSGLSFKEPEFQAAMDIFGDAILKEMDPRRTKDELDELARIEDGDGKSKEKCTAVWTIITGETES